LEKEKKKTTENRMLKKVDGEEVMSRARVFE
jgi:hypothetical protein